MKLKGINAFEQHVEKIVLGVAVLGAAGIVAWQVLSAPTVKLGSREVSHSGIDPLLESKAKELRSRLEGDSNIEIPVDGVTLAAPAFASSLDGAISPADRLARTAPSFNGALVKSGGSAVDVWYYEPSVPALQMRGVHETADALTAEAAKEAVKASAVLAARPEFQKIDGPKDVVWTTPFARIDLKRLRAELAGSRKDASPPLMPIPGVWYQETAYVVDIAFERREKGADGSWGKPQAVPVFAARSEELNFRGRIDAASAETRDEVFALLGSDDNQKEILQPTFYDTVNGAFVSPAVLADAGSEPVAGVPQDAGAIRRRMQLQTQLQDKQRRAQTVRTELEKLGGPWDEDAEKKKEEDRKREERDRKDAEKAGSKGGGAGGKGPGGGGPGGGGSMSGKNNPQGDNDEKEARRKAAERKTKTMVLRRVESEISSLERELGAEQGSAPGAPKPKAATLASLDELLVWGHDLEVVPGRTYQYRCVAKVYNPFFGKGNQLVQKQADKGLASAFAIASAASDWSSEVTVSPDVRFFVTRALVGDGTLALGSAQIEVYKLLGGKWRRWESSVQPGERIGRVDDRAGGEAVDFSTEYFVVDVVEDLDSGRAQQSSGKEKRPGMVVVGSISGSGTEVRVPALDMDDADRVKLRAQADAASAAARESDGRKGPGQGGGGSGAPAGPAGGGAGGGKPGPGAG